MSRAHNFTAGPAVLPESVLVELQSSILEYGKTGMGIMEMSHRSKAFDAILTSAQTRLRNLLGIPGDYAILFLQGGASLQFHMHALNLLGPGDAADYINTGVWAKKALVEARRLGDAVAVWDGKASNYDHIPTPGEYSVRDQAVYLHYTTNNTIYGTEWHRTPEAFGRPLVGDLSSDIASRPVDIAAHDLIYAGAQKNLGPSGVTVVILSPAALERSAAVSAARGGITPTLDYVLQAKENSLYNTPSTFGIFALERVLAWLEGIGGVPAIDALNQQKSDMLYGALDSSAFCRGHARADSRSRMNVTWRLPNEELEARFVTEAEAAGLKGLKGHRSVGGLRASLYNALPLASVEALISFMGDFEARNG